MGAFASTFDLALSGLWSQLGWKPRVSLVLSRDPDSSAISV
ncbi:unnamed protein product [Acidithrix sp. C25]|nr:unnamed protein product [Acidithrix sp. C25]